MSGQIDLSKTPRSVVRAAFELVAGRAPTEDELDAHIGGGTLTDRCCENPLCDWTLQRSQARFCTRCWKAIELCRAADAEVSA